MSAANAASVASGPLTPLATVSGVSSVTSVPNIDSVNFDLFDAFIPMETEFIDKKMSVCEWNLLPGCFVRRVTQSNDDQIGSCKEAKVRLTLKILDTNEVIENVDRSQFVPATTVSFGTLFLYKQWIGKVIKVMYSVTLKLDDNSRGVVHMEDISEFVDNSKERRRMPFCAYNPVTKCCVGKRLLGPKKQLRDARWLHISDEMKKFIESDEDESTVYITLVDVGISELRVQWLYCISEESVASAAHSSSSKYIGTASEEVKNNLYRVSEGISSNGSKAPSKVLKGKELFDVKSLNFIANCLKSRIGENGYYIKEGVYGSSNTCHSSMVTENNELPVESQVNMESCEKISEEDDDNEKTSLNEMGNSNSPEKEKVNDDINGNDDNDLLSIMVTFFDDTDSFPLEPIEPLEQYKRKKSQNSGVKSKKRKPAKDCFSLSNNGVPVQIMSSNTLVTVVWPNGEVESDIHPSALVPFDYFMESDDMFPGKFVQKIDDVKSDEYGVIENVSFSERTANVNWYKRMDSCSSGNIPCLVQSELVSTYDIKKDPRLCFYRGAYVFKITESDKDSCNRVGQVINPWCGGQVLCGWANGTQSRVYPHELLILSRVNIVESSKTSLTLPKTVSPVFKSVKETTESLKAMLDKMKNSKVPTSSKFVKMLEDMLSKESKTLAGDAQSSSSGAEEEKDEGFEETCDNKLFDCGELKTLESVPEDHKYKDITFQPANPSVFAKRVKKELMILKNSLPSNIIVKTFENRIDLFSVMICGPKATPYEDGLFLFDIQLPATYPNVPPVVHYYSYCSKRLNPNLYEDGLVCLSLLGTWTGSETEMWSSKSNLLQLLVSIQGLILVDEPYFNEPGYVRQKGTVNGQRKSKLYNEMVVIKLVQSMTKLIENPGKLFADEIRQHFKISAKRFISRLDDWMRLSGKSSDEACSSTAAGDCRSKAASGEKPPTFPLLPCSQGFCISLRREISHFIEVLKSNDIQV